MRGWQMVAGAALLAAAGAGAQGPDTAAIELQGEIAPVHDPVIIREGDTYHVYSTGLGNGPGGIIAHRISRDLIHWQKATPPLAALPDWARRAIPGATNAWAPDIARVNGRYRLYYSISTFGSNRSAIGLLTSATLDPAAPGYGWRDEGVVMMSDRADDYNAIDPNFIADRDGRHWLALGSFWTGLKLFALDPATGKLRAGGEKPVSIARRPVPAGAPDAIEAPFVIDHRGWYWLVASYDYCCKGNASTYYTVIGRSRAVTGPYLGKDDSSMMAGGGTVLLRADLPEQQRYRGPGHAGHFRDADGTDYLVHHAYDRQNTGTPTLRLVRLRWGADGWPVAE
jgi:arabinan endo-1,5-alpha-L-arabinosidase